MKIRQGLGALALLACSGAQAFSCASTEGERCELVLSTVTVVFDAGIYSFDGDSQLNGGDGFVSGFTGGAGQFPELDTVDGGGRAGFSFVTGMQGQVGGSGIPGEHEAAASFAFSNLQFVARPGYRIDAIEFSLDGMRTQVGNGHVSLLLPGVPIFAGDSFSASGLYAPATDAFAAYFSAVAYYEEGEDGTAAAYGTASAAFGSARIVAHVSAVPEPAGAMLALLGGAALLVHGASMRRRDRRD